MVETDSESQAPCSLELEPALQAVQDYPRPPPSLFKPPKMPEHHQAGAKKAGSKKSQAQTKPMGRAATRAMKKNEERVKEALENPDECTYARIVKPLGFGKYEVMHEKGKTGLATLCGLLRSKRGSPCAVDDIVTVERLDGSTAAYKRCYLISAILSQKEASKLKSSGALRDGVFKGMTESAVGGGAGQYDYDWDALPEYSELDAGERPTERRGKGKIGPEPLTYEEYMAALADAKAVEEGAKAVEVALAAPKTANELTEEDIEDI